MIEQNLSEDPVGGILEPFMSKTVEERTKTPPRDEVSSTHVPSADQSPTAAAAQTFSSLVSVRDFSVVEDVVNSFAPHIIAEIVVVVAEIIVAAAAANDSSAPNLYHNHLPALTLFSSEYKVEVRAMNHSE